jgi:exodeoxyribonuclease VII small subunit
MTQKEGDPEETPAFETALGRLESIVAELESGKLPLDEAIVRFEEGLRLVKACRARLNEAELKVRELLEERDGATGGEPGNG